MTQSPTAVLAEYAASTRHQDLPEEVMERTKRIVLDEMCCAVLGRELDAGRLAHDYVLSLGGRQESAVLGAGARVPAPAAALANGTAGHADEFDGAHVTGGHPGAVVVHAAVATAEAAGASGADLLTAVALGYDIGTRLVSAGGGSAGLRRRHRLHSDFLHAFGAAAASARLLGLDSSGHRHAAAMASGQSIGLSALMDERRHISKAFANGQAAYAGAAAARMAALGFEGNDSIFEAANGVLDAWGTEDGAEILVDGLGRDFAVMGSNFKFYSAGYPIHAPVEAALLLLDREQLTIADISHVTVAMNAHTADIVDRRTMPTINLRTMLATAMVHGGLGYEVSHDAALLADPRIAEVSALIHIERIDEHLSRPPYTRGATVTLTTASGARVEHRVAHPRGHALRGEVTWADLETKWSRLMADRVGKERFDAAFHAAQALETCTTVADLSALLTRTDDR